MTSAGVVGPNTWRRLYEVYESIAGSIGTTPWPPRGVPYPGTPLRIGSTGDNVRVIQNSLRAIHGSFPNIPLIAADGIFGPLTQAAVIAFQRIFGLVPDGVVGPITWGMLVRVLGSWNSVPEPRRYPGHLIAFGSRGNDVQTVQRMLNSVSAGRNPSINPLVVDGADVIKGLLPE